MAISDHIGHLRQNVGNDLLHIPSVTILTFDEQEQVLPVRDSGIVGADPHVCPISALVAHGGATLLVKPLRH